MLETELPTILFGVTTSKSIKLLGRIPDVMVQQGWTVHLAANPGPELSEVRDGQIYAHQLPMSRNPSVLKDVIALFRWIGLLRKVRPDVVSIGTPKAAFLGITAAMLCQVPNRVYHLRGLRIEKLHGIRRALLFPFEWLASVGATEILSVSESLSERYRELGFCRNSKISVLGRGSSHGVNTKHFRPRRVGENSLREMLGLDPKSPVIGFVGRFSKDKGSETLLYLQKQLAREGRSCQMLLVGEPENSFADWNSLLYGPGKVVSLGEVKDTSPYFQEMDVLLLPSLREGFPNVVLEAAASGVPTVAYGVTGTVNSIVHGETGLLAEPGDRVGFFDNVRFLLDNPIERARLGQGAMRWAIAEFDEEIVVKAHLAYYAEKLAKAG